ncbi:MAG: hypothetical protein RL701_2691 [Pseudomonadota bacterium]|jgi:hypothetical protein
MRSMRSVLAELKPYKRQIGRAIGLGGMLLIASQLIRATPRTVQVQLDLGPEHKKFVEVRVAYLQAGQELHAVEFAFPEGAPGHLEHAVRLPTGDFEVHTELRPEHGQIVDSVRPLHTPSDEPVHIRVQTDNADTSTTEQP